MQLDMTMMPMMEEVQNGPAPNSTEATSSPSSANTTRDDLTHQHSLQYHHYQPTNYYESLLLDQLQDMVPIMPRERELSKLEVINYVIHYIKQLREMVAEEES